MTQKMIQKLETGIDRKKKNGRYRKRRAETSKITVGDKVYVKEIGTTNKLATTFNPTPHVVEKSVGRDITVRNEESGKVLRKF